MNTNPNLNNEPEKFKTKGRDDGFKNVKHQTEKHDQEKVLKSLTNDNN